MQSPDHSTVLIVDDDVDVTRGASLRLKSAGYDTIVAENGSTGVEAATTNRPAAVVLDMRMPDMDGLTALGILKKNEATRDIPIVMLSACVSAQQESLERGARFFLTKPYHGTALVQAIDKAIEEADATPSAGDSKSEQ